MTKRIGCWANDGSPIGVIHKDIYAKDRRIGVGGAELALFTVLEGFVNRGYDVTLFNDPKVPQETPIRQVPRSMIARDKNFDIFIVFRSPSPIVNTIKAKNKIWWSCDQATVGDFKAFIKQVDHTVLISETHAGSWWHRYRIEDNPRTPISIIDLPIRINDYMGLGEIREENKFIFTSVPDRGLMLLLYLWKHIKKEVPEASLHITSDYRLWGMARAEVDYYRSLSKGLEGINYLGAIPRDELVRLQLSADMLLYPCIYEELFCIACAEAQVAGAFPVTSNTGALKTTNITSGLLGRVHDNNFKTLFLDKVLELLDNREALEKERTTMRAKAIERFSIDRILDQWENLWS